MKILVVSDSHGNHEALEKILLENQNVDLYLHAGDSLENPYSLRPYISVKGNCDYDVNLLTSIKLKTPYGYLYMQHHPYFNQPVIYDKKIKIFIYGHTHIKEFKKIGDCYFINPGSISYSRDSEGPTYCILTINENQVQCDFKYVI